jgi:NADH-quinone oxidoreductase subunit C
MDLDKIANELSAALPGSVIGHAMARGELTVEVSTAGILQVLNWLRDNPACPFEQLIDLCGVDWPSRPKRFDVVYHLLSLSRNARIRIKTAIDENTPVPSSVGLFATASWFERETFDMYGITFSDHPDMRRILTDYGFSGYPLRKDFPLTGYVEVRYDDEQKRVVYRPVKLVQEFRDFDFMSPWEGAPYILPDQQGGKTGG